MERKAGKTLAARTVLTASHRERLIAELRADREFAAEYLNACAEDSDPRVYIAALRDVAEASGMAKIARATGMPCENLRRALSSRGKLRFSTFCAIVKAAGFKIAVVRI